MKAVKRGITIVISILLWAVILLAALFAFTTLATRDQTKVASLAGFTPMIVETDSMSPTFRAGDLILIKKCDPASLKEGDVIKLTDKKGSRYFYEVESMEVVDPYDNSVKDQGEEKVLTLLTCENSGTMRLTVRCSLKEAVE